MPFIIIGAFGLFWALLVELSVNYFPNLFGWVMLAYVATLVVLCYVDCQGPWYEKVIIILLLPFALMALFG